MLTVKYVAPNGEEGIREHLSVIADRTEHDNRPRVLVFDDIPTQAKDNSAGIFVRQDAQTSDEEVARMHNGIVYVMNRFGATVATYRL